MCKIVCGRVYHLLSMFNSLIFSNQELQTSLSTSITVSTAKRWLLNAQSFRAPGHDVDPVRLTKTSLPSSHLGSPGPTPRGKNIQQNKDIVFICIWTVYMYRCIHNMHSLHSMYICTPGRIDYNISSLICQNQKNLPPKSPSSTCPTRKLVKSKDSLAEAWRIESCNHDIWFKPPKKSRP